MRSRPRPARTAGRLLAPALLGALALGSARASVVVPFPFTASFESADGYAAGPLASDSVWTFSPGLSVSVSGPAFDGTQSLLFSGHATLELLPDAQSVVAGYPVTWVDFYLRPVFAPAEDLPSLLNAAASAATGFVKVGSEGEVYAVDGDGLGGGDWIATGQRRPLINDRAADWLRISYRLDYAQKRWDLFLDGRLVLFDLGFADNSVNGFTRFSLRSQSTFGSLLDYFYAGDVNPLFADSDNDGLPDSWLATAGLSGSAASRYADPDHDGVDNITEFLLGLSPANPDSDGDEVFDGRELARGSNPLAAETRALSAFPFADSFEADTPGAFASGTRQWSVSLGEAPAPGSVSVASAPATGADGQQVLTLSGRDVVLEREFARAPGTEIVWLDFRVALARRGQPAPAAPKDSGVVFYVADSGDLMALDGSGAGGGAWVSLAQLPAPSSSLSAFRRYTVRLDYASQSWSLWLDGVRVGDSLGFASPVPYFSGFTVSHEALQAAGFDAVSAAATEPPALDNDGDGLSNDEERQFGSNLNLPDSDADGIWDRTERELGTNPLQAEALVAQLQPDATGAYTWQTHFSAAEGYTTGYLASQQGWQAAGEATVADEAARLSAVTADASIERLFGTSAIDRVWIRFRAKLAPGEMPASAEVGGPVSGMFGYRSENRLAIFDAATSSWTEHTVSATASEWNDYVLYFDYSAKRWLLALNGRLVARDLPFRDTGLSHLARLRVLQQGAANATQPKQAEIDDIVVSNLAFAGLDLDGDGLLDTEENTLGTDPFASDTDGDQMPDAWEVANGLDPLSATDAATDLDGDGFTNLVEFRHATDPASATTALAGKAHWDEWIGIGGSAVRDLTAQARFPNQSNTRDLLTSLEIPANRGNDFGTRLRAWVLPPVSGDYTFWIAGDDEAELWLSTDSQPFAKKLIARNGGWTGSREWEKRPELQRSAPVALAAGQRYYIEALHKQGTGGANLAVAWQIPGQTRALIGPAHLEAFPRFADDQDEDSLSDAWELAHGLDPTDGSGANGYYGDFDGDGLSNTLENTLGTHPGAIDGDSDGLPDALTYYAGISSYDPAAASAALAPWTLSSVGNPAQAAGTVKGASGSIWMQGNESGPGSSGDTFRYLHQPVTGDFELIAAVREIASTEGSFGLILRDGLGNKAPISYLELQKGGSYRYYIRSELSGSLRRYGKINSLGLPPGPEGYWLKLRRQGSAISAYYSGDGKTWTYFTGVTQALPATCQVGFATWNNVSTATIREITRAQLRLDADGDGLFDEEEALLGTDPANPDSDGDGLLDREESLDIGTDALGADPTPAVVATYTGMSGLPSKGEWSVQGTTLHSVTPLGAVDYTVTLASAGIYRVQLDVRNRRNFTGNLYFPFEFSVDGQFVERAEILIPNDETRTASVTLPWLAAGAHTVRVFFDNTLTHRAIALNQLRVLSHGGADLDGNGRPDWMDGRLAGLNRVFDPAPASFVSPFTVEGIGRFQSMMSVSANGQAVAHKRAPGEGWFAHIPLSPDASTSVEASFENGALAAQRSVTWTPLNLLVDPLALPSGRLVIRKNDRVLFSAIPADEAHLGGSSSLQITAPDGTVQQLGLGSGEDDNVQQLFAVPGVYTVSASYASGAYAQTGSLSVEVVEAEFADNPIVGLNRPYLWKNPKIGAGLVVEPDDGLILDQSTALAEGGTQFRAISQNLRPQAVVARLGENGPIAASAVVESLRVNTGAETSGDLIETLANGTMLIGTPVFVSQIPQGLRLEVEIFVNGVTFQDGTTRKILHAEDFDQIDRAYLIFVYPAGLSTSYCHRIHVHIGSVYLGTL